MNKGLRSPKMLKVLNILQFNNEICYDMWNMFAQNDGCNLTHIPNVMKYKFMFRVLENYV